MPSNADNSNDAPFKVRLNGHPQSTVKKSGRHTLCIPSTMSLLELKKEAHQLYASSPYDGNAMTLFSGFPPLEVINPDLTPARSCLKPMDTLLVRISTAATVAPSQATTSNTTTATGRKRPLTGTSTPPSSSQDDTTARSTRPKRKAAQEATASFKDVIKAQNKIMKSEKKRPTKSKPVNQNSTAKKRSLPKPRPKIPDTDGRKISDGSTIRSSSRKHAPAKFKSKDDISTSLLDALNSSNPSNKVNSTLRSVMRNKVSNAYETSKANARFSSAYSRNVTFVSTSADVDDGRMTVRFDKGIEGRGQFEDHVDVIGREALEAVIKAVFRDNESREMLRPRNMAQVSPRFFWSLVRHCQVKREKGDDGCHDNNVEGMLRFMVPDLDWTFLNVGRKRELSQKAQENQRQERVVSGQEENDQNAFDKSEEAIRAVEEAMEKVYEEDNKVQRDRMARAATQRLGGTTHTSAGVISNDNVDNWKLITPNDLDMDELQDCLSEGLLDDDCNSTGNQQHSEASTHQILANIMVQDCSVHNWRELANSKPSLIHSVLSSSNQHNLSYNIEQVESIIHAARSRSLDEIMIEICDEKEPVFVALREGANTGTPKDLANWLPIPEMLLEESNINNLGLDDSEDNPLYMTNDVLKWCRRAQLVLNTLEWVDDYATPVVRVD